MTRLIAAAVLLAAPAARAVDLQGSFGRASALAKAARAARPAFAQSAGAPAACASDAACGQALALATYELADALEKTPAFVRWQQAAQAAVGSAEGDTRDVLVAQLQILDRLALGAVVAKKVDAYRDATTALLAFVAAQKHSAPQQTVEAYQAALAGTVREIEALTKDKRGSRPSLNADVDLIGLSLATN